MPYVVTEDCIRCKYMYCVERCPVGCFHEGENMLVIHPDECIDCAACESNCPVTAIVSDINSRAANWALLNRRYSAVWPKIRERGRAPADAREWEDAPGKYVRYFSPDRGTCHLPAAK